MKLIRRALQFLIDAIDALVADDRKREYSQRDQFQDQQKRWLTYLGSGGKWSRFPPA